jgi:hypothetical protein
MKRILEAVLDAKNVPLPLVPEAGVEPARLFGLGF